jgi:transketolase
MDQTRPAEPLDRTTMAATLRRWIVQRSFEAGVGHIASGLCVADIMTVLWGDVLRDAGGTDPDRDRFVLAKGHAALCLYAALRWTGRIDEATFRTFCKDGSNLGVHPEPGLPGVEVATGSLGQGLSVACGIAFALKARQSPAKVYVLLSDAECNEGQVWEAAMFAAQHRLDNLIAVVDFNEMQALGWTRDILDQSNLAQRWAAFGWRSLEADGHDEDALRQALTTGIADRTGPAVVVARTQQGKGVSFMERKLEWHYRNLTPELAARAADEIGRAL